MLETKENGECYWKTDLGSSKYCEVFYLRRMLTHVRGPTSYIDIRTINNVIYSTFRETCLALGILADDTEYVEAIKEAKDWGSGHYLRKLFVTIMLSNSVDRPEDLWNKT